MAPPTNDVQNGQAFCIQGDEVAGGLSGTFKEVHLAGGQHCGARHVTTSPIHHVRHERMVPRRTL
jgi:hypothetical protein